MNYSESDLLREIAGLRASVVAERRRADEIESSKSWQITKPLRQFRSLFSGSAPVEHADTTAGEVVPDPAYRDERSHQDSLQRFAGYTDEDLRLIDKFTDHSVAVHPGVIVDFAGVITRTSAVWEQARIFDGRRLPPPIPADFHAEAVEWVGLLKAVDRAEGSFRMVELGAGFGPWVVAGGVAARFKGIKDIVLYGVEGDELHCTLMREHFDDNGFGPDVSHVLQAAVGTKAGTAQWPKPGHDAGSSHYNLRPVLDGTDDYMGRDFQEMVTVDVIAFNDILKREAKWDLVHIDIQGHEVDVCRSAIKLMNERVKQVIVGTHSRKIDGDLLDLMKGAGWILENEKPARFHYDKEAPTLEAMTYLDGTQVWTNPRLA